MALDAAQPQSVDAVRQLPPLVAFSPAMWAQSTELKRFLFRNLYRHPQVMQTTGLAQQMVHELLAAYMADPALMQAGFAARNITGAADARTVARAVADCDARHDRPFRRPRTWSPPASARVALNFRKYPVIEIQNDYPRHPQLVGARRDWPELCPACQGRVRQRTGCTMPSAPRKTTTPCWPICRWNWSAWAEADPAKLDTSLLIVPNHLADFLDFNDLAHADALLVALSWTRDYRSLISYPRVPFGGTNPGRNG